MSNNNPSPPDLTRRRKLDDLFGDEPFLSPTMKARRLNDTRTHPVIAGEDKSQTAVTAPNTTLLGLVPDVTEEDSAAFWRQRTGSDRPPLPQDSEGILLADGEFGRPAATILKIVDTGSGIDYGSVESAISAALSFDAHDPGLPATRTPVMSAHSTGDPGNPSEARRPGGPISLRSAAEYLRAECLSSGAPVDLESLRWFRADVLPRWLKYLPQREHDGVVEEY